MSRPNPMSRDTMRGLKAQIDEEAHLKQVNDIISRIYNMAVQQAKNIKDTKYNYEVPMHPQPPKGWRGEIQKNEIATFHNDNMEEILSNLRLLFPECLVESKSITMAVGNDGKSYDVSDLDEKALAFVRNPQTKYYITVDWT